MAYKVKNKKPAWQKSGWDVEPSHQNILVNPRNDKVCWIDNWSKGNYAVVYGKELPSEYGSVKYKEEGTYINVKTKAEAKKYQKEYIENGIRI